MLKYIYSNYEIFKYFCRCYKLKIELMLNMQMFCKTGILRVMWEMFG